MTLPLGDHLRTLEIGGRQRRYLYHVPAAPPPSRSYPLVLSFHGSNSNGQIQQEFTAMNETADRHGFLVVYPFGTGERERLLFWNAGNCCGPAFRRDVDDVAFIDVLLVRLQAELPIDPRAIYATGMSNGAMMAYRLAAERASAFAAIAPVAGTMGSSSCTPSQPVSVLHIHGTEDEFVPVQGGVGRRTVSGTPHFSVQHSISAWVAANGCPPDPFVETLYHDPREATTTVRHTYGPGRDGAEVVLYLVQGMGHTWPGRPPRPVILGKSTFTWSANEVIWDFFQRHRRH